MSNDETENVSVDECVSFFSFFFFFLGYLSR